MVEIRLHLSRPGLEKALMDELTQELPESKHQILGDGVIESLIHGSEAGAQPVLAFCIQALPSAQSITGESISLLAQAAYAFLLQSVSKSEKASPEMLWRSDFFEMRPEGVVVSRRAELIDQSLQTILKKQRRALLKARLSDGEEPILGSKCSLFQLCLLSRDVAYCSFARPECIGQLEQSMTRFHGGVVTVEKDSFPPSRAYLKLLEVEKRMDIQIQAKDVCVDLGASPGGWTAVALARKARVIAVDRSPLRGDLMQNKLLQFHKGDAFAFRPDDRVDWLLCDVAAFPEKSLALLSSWLENAWCRRFAVTLKFRGSEDYHHLASAKQILRKASKRFELRQLCHNKNEVTAFGEV